MTPPPVLDAAVASFPVFREAGLHYTTDDIARKAQIVRDRPEQVVDLASIFAGHEPGEILLGDGLHLSAAGQAAVARHVIVAALTS